MASEKTLILIKPDGIYKKLIGTVIDRFQAKGFELRALKMMQLSESVLEEHYAHITDRPFYPKLVDFMTCTPVIALILEGENVISTIRTELGATDSPTAEEGTIRRLYGTNSMFNICHASDSPEAAEVEIKRFFSAEEVFDFEDCKFKGEFK